MGRVEYLAVEVAGEGSAEVALFYDCGGAVPRATELREGSEADSSDKWTVLQRNVGGSGPEY